MTILKVLLRQLFGKPATNPFPASRAPKSATAFLQAIQDKRVAANPPVAVPPGFRGKLQYDREKCIGCQLCIKVCPGKVIEFIPEQKKVKFFITRCCFCAQCADVCPVDCIAMTDEFLLADTDKRSPNLVVTQ
jgi:formate hydrogenlyase subunit 6/NADH:ubiquinone oxidoreductase subunit I